jgi:hypothetical protein
VLGSNLGWDGSYWTEFLRDFPKSFQQNTEMVSRLLHDRFIPNISLLDYGELEVRVPRGAFLHNAKTGSGAHPTSYPKGTEGSIPGDKAASALS